MISKICTPMLVAAMMACSPAPSADCQAIADDRLQLMTVTAPPALMPGVAATIETKWRVVRDLLGTNPQLFVHVTAPGGVLNLLQADHQPQQPVMQWHVGDVITDSFALTLPPSWPAAAADIRLGWYEGGYRWPVRGGCAALGADAAVVDPQHDRWHISIPVTGVPSTTIDIPRRSTDIIIDGNRDISWSTAATLGPFASWDGKEQLTRPTTALALWDDDALWLLFAATDPHPHSPYHHDDDPLYESEALEVFIDGNADGHDYIEVQANIHDAHFDASFVGGARQGMNRSYTSGVVTKTVHQDGVTTSEWRLPWTALVDRPSSLLGSTMAVNLFRLERITQSGISGAVKTEASAWQSPLSGDFHNLARFGRWRLAP